MPLTKAQIEVLRHAAEFPCFETTDGKTTHHPLLPFKGAIARSVTSSLLAKGYLDASGRITLSGRGALLISPEATSEVAP